eukprot:Tbor_TRINITY_DN2719_c0_g1::TRINITY_DN2719_c0_g1_i1::g.15161::m.15161
MVFMTLNMIMRPRNRVTTKQTLLEFAHHIYQQGGLIRKLSNEGIIRPYKKFRDTNNEVMTYARYVQWQLDYKDVKDLIALEKHCRAHPDVFVIVSNLTESSDVSLLMHKTPTNASGTPDGKFRLDAFSKMEEEIYWPPQASADVYENLDRNWKEFSRTRWSNYLRD